MFLVRETIGKSRWEPVEKWDSYGAQFILGELFSGRMLDFGRLPFLTVFLGLGIIGICISWRKPVARRLAALSGLWLVLFFGRKTRGPLMLLAGVPAEMHLHRLQAVFELSAIIMAAYGVTGLIALIARRTRIGSVFCALAIGAFIIGIGLDRAAYFRLNREWGEQNLAAYALHQADLDAALTEVRTILSEKPGRVNAGPSNGWGRDFKIGSVTVFSFLSRERLDQTSFLFHSLSKSSDIMLMRRESAAHDTLFGIRAVVAPLDHAVSSQLRPRGTYGMFAVYESSPEGYFGLVDLGGRYTGPASALFDFNSAWLYSPLQASGVVLSLERTGREPAVTSHEALPALRMEHMRPRGRIISESKTGETYRAHVHMLRPAYVLLKITWHSHLSATVNGQAAPLIHVTPGFGVIPVPAGEHQVEVSFRPGPLRLILLVMGIFIFAVGNVALGRKRAGH